MLQGKPNSEEHVKTFNAWTSLDGEEWKKEKPLPKVSILLYFLSYNLQSVHLLIGIHRLFMFHRHLRTVITLNN